MDTKRHAAPGVIQYLPILSQDGGTVAPLSEFRDTLRLLQYFQFIDIDNRNSFEMLQQSCLNRNNLQFDDKTFLLVARNLEILCLNSGIIYQRRHFVTSETNTPYSFIVLFNEAETPFSKKKRQTFSKCAAAACARREVKAVGV